MTRSNGRTLRRLALTGCALLFSSQAVLGQTPAATVAQRPAAASPFFSAADALDLNAFAIGDLSDDGKWLALTQSVRRDAYGNDYRHDGDPTYVKPTPVLLWSVDAHTGQRQAIFADKRPIRATRWSPDGSQLAFLSYNGDVFVPAVWTRATDQVRTVKLPVGKYVAESSDIRWTKKGDQLVVAVHTTDWRKKARDMFAQITGGPVFVQNSTDPFLAWDDLRRMGNLRSVGALDVRTGAYQELVPETRLNNYTVADDGSTVSYTVDQTKKTEYEAPGNDGRIFTRTATGTPRTLLVSTRGTLVAWSEDGMRYAYSKDGRVYVGTMADSSARLIIGPPEPVKGAPVTPPDTSAAGKARARTERFSVSRFSPRGDALLVSNGEGQWVIDLATNAKDLAIATADSNPTAPRIAFAAWTEDGSKLYFTSASRTKWERGIIRYDRAKKTNDQIIKDGRTYSGVRLAKDGSVAFLNVTEGNRPGELFTANGDLSNLHRFVESNPQLAAKRFGPTDLLSYLDADGHSKFAVVHYPADYEKGKAYPTVFIIYEDFFDDTWDVAANVLAANGYLVVKPSVDFDTGYPGEAWVKGVTAAANKLIEMGVADSSKLGVQGTSYGGYATNLLITQTNRFKAAINISGKVDIISFYTDSPRLGVRNITAAERQQDRIGATLWQQPQKYVQHSAVMFADRITTPLMLITGAQDSNVPEINSREMYYALRRLGKEVVWVSYANGGHGGGVASADDFLDMYKRMVEWYDSKLKKPGIKATSDK
jgi:dipeptidyl aminopeptidase/acylaminoacyl peptidase